MCTVIDIVNVCLQRTILYTQYPMQAVPTLELLPMDELLSLGMGDDFADLDIYLDPETRDSGRMDGVSCCGVRENLKIHIQRKRRERGELKDLTAMTDFDMEPEQQQVRRTCVLLLLLLLLLMRSVAYFVDMYKTSAGGIYTNASHVVMACAPTI